MNDTSSSTTASSTTAPSPASPDPSPTRSRPGRAVAVGIGVATLALFAGGIVACTHPRERGTAAPAAALRPTTTAPGTASAGPPASLAAPPAVKVGLVTTSAGEGSAVAGDAAGAQVAAYRLGGLKAGGPVELRTEDDHGDPVAAVAAVQRLVADGVSAIVYASTGDHVLGAVAAARDAGVPVLLPYDGDARLAAAGIGDVYLTGPSDAQAAATLARWATAHHQAKVAVLHDQGAAGVAALEALKAAGLTPSPAVAFDQRASDQAAAAAAALAGTPDAVVVWADLPGTQAALAALRATSPSIPVLLGPSAANQGFGRLQAGSLAPAGTDGLVSAGPWAGWWTPTSAVDAFYAARRAASTTGAFPGVDLADAGLAAHDAVVAVADAARTSRSGTRSAVREGLHGLHPATAGAPLDLSRAAALGDGSVAALVYSTVPDGAGRTADPGRAGGHWVAIPGTYEPPSTLRGVDDPFGA